LLLLECRTSQDFYSTPAYRLVRRYSGILTGILEQGKAEGMFRSDVDLRLARGCILGALDMENISSLGSGEIANSQQDFEGLADLAQAMLAPHPEPDSAKRNKSEAILQAAVTVFSEKGFNKAKISDIATLAGVADGTVYEYFANKEDLLMSIPAKHFDSYLANLEVAFEIRNPLRKLRRLIKYHFVNFLTERDFSKIFVLQLQYNRRFLGSKAFESQRRYFQFIEEIISEGQAQGVFRQDVVPRVFRNLFLGAFNHMALHWLILEESSTSDKLSEINQITDLLCDAVLPEGLRQAWATTSGLDSGPEGAGPEIVD
jgi:TetR/AcrR family fatty acid metabolism transcriptional regulator